MAVRITVCGRFSVARDDVLLSGTALGTRKARVVLSTLAAARGTWVSTDRLVDEVWGEAPPADPAANVATLVSRLRKTLGGDVIRAGQAAYALSPTCSIDLDEATALVRRAATRLSHGEPALTVAAANRALAIVTGDDPEVTEVALTVEATRREARHLLSEALAQTGDLATAQSAARSALASDPYDERAHRDLIRSLALDGRQSAALDEHARLITRLGEELGTDPDPETVRLQLAILRGLPLLPPTHGDPRQASEPADVPRLVGREDEMTRLEAIWGTTATEGTSLVLVTGVPGIGKTRLLAEAASLAAAAGGLVLTARCHEGERSMFLQPCVEALRPALLRLPEPRLRAAVGPHTAAWTWLVPELGDLLEVDPGPQVEPELVRRRYYEAIRDVLVAFAAEQPVLLSIDDLQYGAAATAELLAYLQRHLGPAPVLLLGALRSEALPLHQQLLSGAVALHLSPLPASAVTALAAAAGLGRHAEDVQARTHGHPLSVVESLRALTAGTGGVPETLAAAVANQLAVLDETGRRVAEGASVLGSRVETATLADLVDQAEIECVRRCEQLRRAGLLDRDGRGYQFANDLLRDAVYATLPTPLAAAYHRRAADLLADHPEAMAGHASAAGDPTRAAQGWLQAARTARRTAALDDAVAILDQAEQAASDDEVLVAIRLERARAHEARAAFDAAFADAELALGRAIALGERRLEMRAQRLLGGDVSVALGRPMGDIVTHNEAGMRLAAQLGDRVAESLFRSRLVVLRASRLQLTAARHLADHGVRESRGTGSGEATIRALDGLKTVHTFCADAAGLETVLGELLPILTSGRITWLLQWAVLESALVPAAGAEWGEARRRVDRALELNASTGYSAYAGYFRAQRGWLARLSGDLDGALADGRRSVAETSPTDHPWWYAAAIGCYATSLWEAGRLDEAAQLSADGLAAIGTECGEAYRLRCLGPLVATTGAHLEETDRLLRRAEAPVGQAWVSGADVYDAVAAGWMAAGEPGRAAEVVAPLLAATSHGSWSTIHRRAAQRIVTG